MTSGRYEGTVAVWFTTHSQVDSRDWDNIEEFDGNFHPLIGYYKSDDVEVIRKQLTWARECNPDILFLSGWNDWQYGNQIEPAVEYGFKCVDLTAELLGRAQETERYRRGDAGEVESH